MKAWYLDIKDDPDQGAFIVFANTRNEARGQAGSCDLVYDTWLDVQARRFKSMDGKEHLDAAHLALELWHNHGWRYIDYLGEPDVDEATDEEFLKWHKETF